MLRVAELSAQFVEVTGTALQGICHHRKIQYLLSQQEDRTSAGIGIRLAGAEGLEPTTLGFGDRCSTN